MVWRGVGVVDGVTVVFEKNKSACLPAFLVCFAWLLFYLVNLAEGDLLNTLVLDNLTQDTTITSSDDQDLLGVGVGVHGDVGHHLLVAIMDDCQNIVVVLLANQIS